MLSLMAFLQILTISIFMRLFSPLARSMSSGPIFPRAARALATGKKALTVVAIRMDSAAVAKVSVGVAIRRVTSSLIFIGVGCMVLKAVGT